jgi:hypothetical protein
MGRSWLSELKIPAEPEFIPVAKRVAVSLGSKLGFSLEELDELSIAITQACDSAMHASQVAWGPGATLKLTYGSTERGIEVEVHAQGPRSVPLRGPAHRPIPDLDDLEIQRLANEMIRFFVDDFRSQVDAGSGRVRFRMRKYLIS